MELVFSHIGRYLPVGVGYREHIPYRHCDRFIEFFIPAGFPDHNGAAHGFAPVFAPPADGIPVEPQTELIHKLSPKIRVQILFANQKIHRFGFFSRNPALERDFFKYLFFCFHYSK